MTPTEVFKKILPEKKTAALPEASAFAPSNIALIKYWGKRNDVLNLPHTSSLSLSLGHLGTTTRISRTSSQDCYTLNHQLVLPQSSFFKRLKNFLDLCRPTPDFYYQVDTHNNIPTMAGLASSASGFAALVLALNALHHWDLSLQNLSILSRLGSGSACRSLWPGFVKWHRGTREDGMDSHGEPLLLQWPELQIGLCILSEDEKKVSSREAMQRLDVSSKTYRIFVSQTEQSLANLEAALWQKDFLSLGQIAELNAMALHTLIESTHPPVCYTSAQTLALRERVKACRTSGLAVYFTQDAGENLKLLFLKQDAKRVQLAFPELNSSIC